MFLGRKSIKMAAWSLAVVIPFFYNGCGQSFESINDSVTGLSSNNSSGTNDSNDQANNTPPSTTPPPTMPPTTTPPPPTIPPVNQKTVIIAIGTGGLRMLSSDGFITFESKTIDVSGTLNLITPPNCVDPAATVINNKCCYNQDGRSCYESNGHSDFQLRDIAYGQGKFIAVGGAGFGISRTSVDGNNWSARSLWVSGNSFIKKGSQTPGLISTIIYHQGEFLAMSGFGGLLYHSTDGVDWYNDSTNLNGTVFGYMTNTGSGFFATGQQGAWAYSKDGKTWDANGNHPDGLRFFDPATDGKILLVREAYTNGQTKFARKAANNSSGWVAGQTLSANITDLIYSSQSKKFHAYAQGKVYLSDDGSQWQQNNINVNTTFQSVFYANNFYLAQSYNWQTAESKIYQSMDGITWTLIPGEGPGKGQNIYNYIQATISN